MKQWKGTVILEKERMGRTNFTWRIKEQATCLTPLFEHDDNDDDEERMMMVSKGQERWGVGFHCSSRSVGTADVA
jgi:hypothetical protein